MKVNYITIFLLVTQCLIAQKIDTVNDSVKFIEDYYSDFQTGYDFDGKYIVLSNNYNATFSKSVFTLTFDSFDEQNNIQTQTNTINLKDVISLENGGGSMVEIHDCDTLIVPIAYRLGFKTGNETYEINIDFDVEVEVEVEQSHIFKAFKFLIENYKH